MRQYHEAVQHVLDYGYHTTNRTGIDTLSVFGYQMRFDLNEGFPAITTKRLAWKAVVGELLWFLEGSTDERRLAELTYGKSANELVGKRTIWTDNADNQAVALGYLNNDHYKELGPIYGSQWRDFNQQSVDQIANVIQRIKTNPDCRRLIVSAWNPVDLPKMTLPPCHVMFQFRVINGNLSCHMYQRSADLGLGVPFNIASYSLLTHLIARECDLGVGEFVHSFGDLHIYENHIEPLKRQLENEDRALPTLKIDPSFDLWRGLDCEFELDSVRKFTLDGYDPHEKISMDMAV